MEFQIRTVEAWRNEDGGWTWNNSFVRGAEEFTDEDLKPRRLLRYLREAGYLSETSKGKLRVDDQDSVIEIQKKGTYEPILALIRIEKEVE